MDHVEVQQYAQQVAAQLRARDITVSHVHVDTPEEAAEIGREYIRVGLAHAGLARALVWSDQMGWMTSTWADHYPLLGGEISPDPGAVARAAASHIHTLAHGGHLQAV